MCLTESYMYLNRINTSYLLIILVLVLCGFINGKLCKYATLFGLGSGLAVYAIYGLGTAHYLSPGGGAGGF